MALKYGSKKGGVQLRSGNGVPFKQMGSSPNKQGNLPVELQEEIKAAPTKMYGKKSAIKNYKKGYYGA